MVIAAESTLDSAHDHRPLNCVLGVYDLTGEAEMEDEQRPLPSGWVREYDPKAKQSVLSLQQLIAGLHAVSH